MATDTPTEAPRKRTDARQEQLRKASKLPRPAARRGSPEWQLAEMLGIPNHPAIKHWDRKYRTELRKAGQKNPPETLVQLAVRQHVMVEMIDANLLKEPGGPVHRRKRALHAYIQQRTELVAGLMQLRLKLGLDAETVTVPLSFSDAFRRMIEEDANKPAFDAARALKEARERAQQPEPVVEPVALLDAPAESPFEGPSEPLPLPAPQGTLTEDSVSPPAETVSETFPKRHRDVTHEPVEDLGNPKPAPIIPKVAPVSPTAPRRESDGWSRSYESTYVGREIGGEWFPSPLNQGSR